MSMCCGACVPLHQQPPFCFTFPHVGPRFYQTLLRRAVSFNSWDTCSCALCFTLSQACPLRSVLRSEKKSRFPDFLRLHRSKTRIFGFPEHLVIRVLLLVHICRILRSRLFLGFVLCFIIILSLSLLVLLILTLMLKFVLIFFFFLDFTPHWVHYCTDSV